MQNVLGILREKAHLAGLRAHVPYSGQKTGAALLLSDGSWVPGVRIESASFSLVIPAPMAACVAAIGAGRTDAVALALSRPVCAQDILYLCDSPLGVFQQAGDHAFLLTEHIPSPGKPLNLFMEETPLTPESGIRTARNIARRACVECSGFPVGCILKMQDGRLLPGVNVEHHNWSHTLCAERSALAAAISTGHTDIETIYLTCVKDPTGSPCGACRQLLLELAPETIIWLDRGHMEPEHTTTTSLLPGAFRGQGLPQIPLT